MLYIIIIFNNFTNAVKEKFMILCEQEKFSKSDIIVVTHNFNTRRQIDLIPSGPDGV